MQLETLIRAVLQEISSTFFTALIPELQQRDVRMVHTRAAQDAWTILSDICDQVQACSFKHAQQQAACMMARTLRRCPCACAPGAAAEWGTHAAAHSSLGVPCMCR